MQRSRTVTYPSGRTGTITVGGDDWFVEGLVERIEKGTLRTTTGASILHMAAGTMTADHCGMLIETVGCEINGTDEDGRTPLFRAIYYSNWETTLFLIEHGADVTWSATDGETPLHAAAERGSKKIVELLLSKGAELHVNASRGTPLHYAAAAENRETLEFLLELKANPNPSDSSLDASPFFQAIKAKCISIECLDLLVKAGADPNRASYLITPLDFAATRCDAGIIVFLLQAGADPNILDPMGLKPIENAALKGRREVVELLFPLTSRVEFYPDWSISGLIQHADSREENVMSKSKLKEISLLAKVKGGEAFKRKHYYDAAAWYKKALELDPNDAKVLSNRSLCFSMRNDGTKALKNAKACIALKPDWATAHYREGAAWKVLKDFEKAANAFSKALALEPHNEVIKEELRAVRAKADERKKYRH